MTRYRSIVCLLLLVLSLSGTVPAVANTNGNIPRVLGNHFEAREIADFLGERQLVLLHDTTTAQTEYGPKKARYVTTMVVIDTAPEVVRRTVKDFENYPEIHPSILGTTITDSGPATTDVKYRFELNLPVISPYLTYTLQYAPGQGDDLVWHQVSGDLGASYGRWQFRELSETRTLLSYTGWGDFSGLGLAIDTILWAQPELKLAIPVSGSAVVMRNFKEYLSKGPVSPRPDTPPENPTIPLFTDRGSIPGQLIDLMEFGTPMIIHPGQTILKDSGEPLDLRFVTGMEFVDTTDSRAKQLMTRFDKVPEFVNQLSYVHSRKTDTGYVADWEISLGLGYFALGVNYRISYEWTSPQALVYRSVAGDLKNVYGALEWIPYGKNRTLYFLTSAHDISERDSYLVQLGNLIPNRQIAVGVSFAGIGVEKHINWANKQIRADTSGANR